MNNLEITIEKNICMVQFHQLKSKSFQKSLISFSLLSCSRICSKAIQKLDALSRIAKYISEDKKRMLFQSFIIPQFNYFPIAWMCQGKDLNNKINNIHEKTLRIVYQDKKSSFETLLKCDKSTSIHTKKVQYLVTKLFKVKNDLSPEITKEIFVFQENETYNLWSGNHLARKNIRTTRYGIEVFQI